MRSRTNLLNLLMGADPKMRRMLNYWAATCALYAVCLALMFTQVANGSADRDAGRWLCAVAVSSIVAGYALIRASAALRIAPAYSTMLQSLMAIFCTVAFYTVTGPIRGACLMILLVVIVFCTFSLRPRQTMALCATAIAALGAAIVWLVAHDPLRYPFRIEALHFAIASATLLAVTLLTGEMSKLRSRLKQQKEELLSAVATIRTLATIDELTSLANRRHMNQVLSAEERRQPTPGEKLCIALLDIDFFKRVNDCYGHAGGDIVLCTFAGAARAELRAGDVLARWGGEEFLLMLPNTDLAEASLVLRRMAERVGAMRVPELDVSLRITFSAGVVERAGEEAFADTIMRADKAMYQAKSTGRNQAIAA
ncbi:MAG: diguanylate cyclase [Massilia sp.]